jgi:cell wall-associated NlpC family hydrolase
MIDLEPRLHAWRDDLADARLKGRVAAARFVEGAERRVVASAAPLKRVPRADAGLDSEVLRGEVFTVFEDTGEGWSWGQLATDSYVGYVPTGALADVAPAPTHRVTALRTFIYPAADMKLPARGYLSLGAAVRIDGETETRGTLYRRLAGSEGAVVAGHLEPMDAPPANDFVAVAERFLNVPYLWGGRTSLGLDCSSLVQLSLMVAGRQAPRDTDLQESMLGSPVDGGTAVPLQRGDLLFWPGHVAIMIDGEYMVHASGHHGAVVIEALATALERIGRTTGAPRAVKRL